MKSSFANLGVSYLSLFHATLWFKTHSGLLILYTLYKSIYGFVFLQK